MRKILTAAALLASAATFAQNINPTVEVTNTYQGNPSEVHKPQLGMAIPDSLMRFDMDFGYEVFDKPYQGAYNFKPYMLAMKPEKDAYRGRKLYLKTGAGYSLHPQLDFVFSPEQSGPFQMSVYASHRSYFGRYNSLSPVLEDGLYKIDKVAGKSFKGHDAATSAGLDGRYAFGSSILSFGIGYKGLMAKDTVRKRYFNAADFNARIRSNRDDDTYLYYDVAIEASYGSDHLDFVKDSPSSLSPLFTLSSYYPLESVGSSKVNEGLVRFHGEAGPVLGASQRIILGFDAQSCSYSGDIDDNASILALVPSYRYKKGPWDMNLGVRVEKIFSSDPSDEYLPPLHTYKGATVFPAVSITYAATDKLQLYASATGGNKLNPYSSVISRHHFISQGVLFPIMDFSTEKVNAKVGLRGRYSSALQFEVDGGAAVLGNGILDGGMVFRSAGLPAVEYSDYSVIYADALMDLHVGDFKVNGGLHLRHSALKYDTDYGLMMPKLTCDVKAVYEIGQRIYAGTRLEASTARKGNCRYLADGNEGVSCEVKIPGYLDLGLLAGYQFSRKLGFWLESGNLLCESIQRNPFYSEKDLWITAGITLSL